MEMRKRSKDMFPQVLLTLLSIVQALALENIWQEIQTDHFLFSLTYEALVGWVLLTICLLIVIMIWLLYAGIVMRFRVMPSMADLIVPFFIGLIQFHLVQLSHVETVGPFLIFMGILYFTFSTVHQRILRRARHDMDNQEFFSRVGPNTMRDQLRRLSWSLLHVAFGTTFYILSYEGPLIFIPLSIALFALVMAFKALNKYWTMSLEDEPNQADQ